MGRNGQKMPEPENGFVYGPYLFSRGRWWHQLGPNTKLACPPPMTFLLNELYAALSVLLELADLECSVCALNPPGSVGHHDEPVAVEAARRFVVQRVPA